jgi:Mg/Co/Ni transporter MgtE
MRELKETIRLQASEIDRLKEALSSRSSSTPAASGHAGHHHHHGGPSGGGEDYKLKPFYAIARERVGWLSFFICTLSLTAMIMNGFEHTLSRQIELAYFVPLLAGHGGNTGGQAVGTVLSALSSGVVKRGDAFGVIAKEAASGLTMGLVLGAFVGPIAHYVMGISRHVSTVVSVTFPLLSTIAATMGSSLPFVCVALGLDPAVIAAPAMTSFVDVTGLLCYFLLANRIFQLFGLEL